MLQKLSIKNYAIIDELEIGFSPKLNVITGETGAGKSIIVGALGLILGERADSSVLVNHQKKCFVEGLFGIKNNEAVKKLLEANEWDGGDELIIRREIGTNGKSRAFINDSPVSLTQLSDLSSMLVDLHQQFDTLRLGERDFQTQVLDGLAGNSELLQEYHSVFKNWQLSARAWELLTTEKKQFEKEYDYHQFQFNELEEMGLHANELEDLDVELKILSNAEGIKAALEQVYQELSESDQPIASRLKTLVNQLHHFTNLHPDLPALAARLQSAQIELQDIADETERLSNHIQFDAATVERISERLSSGYKLFKKHGVKSTGELIQVREQLAQKLQAVMDIDEQIAQKEKETAVLLTTAKRLAQKLSDGRKKQVKPLEDNVNALLAQVGMPNARLKVELATNGDALHTQGIDSITFLFDANNNGQLQPLRKVASGGELSRLMLCVKSLVAESVDWPTMIFDEIDSGISGEAARQVGAIMKKLTRSRQVVCITHQPQIAGKADAHFFVYKETAKDSGDNQHGSGGVRTNIKALSTEERITVIAKMLGGEKPTAAAMENAREMVSN